jgi:quercetin dioxygenase-like cupin family protein/DNA-binding XRE family transcriptional regulator
MSTSTTEADADTWLHLGAAIRQRRHAQQLTLVDLAGLTLLSQPFLSQVENGRARPSMESLRRIATALGTTPQALFGGPVLPPGAPSVTRRDAAAAVPLTPGASSVCRVLLPGDAPVHLVEYDGLPTEFLDTWQHDGFEAVYVVAGEVEVEVDGAVTRLHAGEVMSYAAQLPHRHRSVGAEQARILLVETTAGRAAVAPSVVHLPARPRARRARR